MHAVGQAWHTIVARCRVGPKTPRRGKGRALSSPGVLGGTGQTLCCAPAQTCRTGFGQPRTKAQRERNDGKSKRLRVVRGIFNQ